MTTAIASVISRRLVHEASSLDTSQSTRVSRGVGGVLLEIVPDQRGGTNSATHPASAADSLPSQRDQGRLRA